MKYVILLILLFFGVMFCIRGPYLLLMSRIYLKESFKILKNNKGLSKLSLKELNSRVIDTSEFYYHVDDPFYQFPIFSHITLIYHIIKDILYFIFLIFKKINNITLIFTYIWIFIKFILYNTKKIILFILIPFIWLKNKFFDLINYIINIKFI